jgi:L-alanine-DL-glutamate epimerase-like enolase superfamily enzyme
MRITRWSLFHYRLPYQREIVWANAIESEGCYSLLRLESDDGAVGLAEGTVKATWSGVSFRSLTAVLDDLLMPALAAVDVGDAAAVSAALVPFPENRLAKGMVETACALLRASSAGQPLWRHLGGTAGVDVTWTVTRQSPGAMAREAADRVQSLGLRALKVKGGQGMDTDRDAIRRIRAAVGDAIVLNVDANSAYRPSEAAAYVRMLEDESVAIAEDPCPLEADSHFQALQHSVGIPILVDRACTTATDARLFLERGARALSTKPGRIGMAEAGVIGALAQARGARVAVGIYAESALGTLINLQQAAAVPDGLRLMPAEQTFFLTLTRQVTALPLTVTRGRIVLPDVASPDDYVDWDRIQAYAA